MCAGNIWVLDILAFRQCQTVKVKLLKNSENKVVSKTGKQCGWLLAKCTRFFVYISALQPGATESGGEMCTYKTSNNLFRLSPTQSFPSLEERE